MRNIILFSLALSLLTLCLAAEAYQDTPASVRLSQTASGRNAKYVTDLSDGWLFGGSGEDASAENYFDTAWPVVNLPHTWNVQDTSDGDGSYSRTDYWYRKALDISEPLADKRYYIEFLGANQQTDLYVNGQHIRLCGSDGYTHKGGYTAFRYDVTDALRPGSNQLAVRVDNTYSEEIAPLSGDFNMYGGIYRRVFLITVNNLHFDLADNGSSGLFLTTPNVRSKERPDDLGTLNIRTNIVNDGPTSRSVTVTIHIDGDNAPPRDITRILTVAGGKTVPFEETVWITDPHLWNGIDYSGGSDNTDVGYRYCVTLDIAENGEKLDTVTDRVGFRYFYVDKDTGFYLNGQSHPLRGVNRHQSKQNLGNALIEADHEQDMELMMEMGVNAVRLAHYPQADIIYDLCDENGIIVWTEIPLVNTVGRAENFLDTTKTQLTELIRQQYNRPSVCFWGLENEVSNNTRNVYTAKQVLSQLDDLAHREDPSGRYTTQATNNNSAVDGNNPAMLADDRAAVGWKSDLIACNIYPGWYSDGTIESVADSRSAQDSRPMGLSEYGWGASTTQHELYPVLGQNGLLNNGKWHPEEYQSQMHEQALRYINAHPHLWGTFVWSMFDFNVDSRNEGSTPGQNDKGLVSNDRTVKKDSFYLYKANWDRRTPLVHITSARFTPRDKIRTYVKVYSNCDSVTLYRNGTLLGEMTSLGDGVFIWEDLDLSIGENKMHAVGILNGQTAEDTCIWSRPVFLIAALESELLPVNEMEGTVTLPWVLTVKEVKSLLYAANDGSYQIVQGNKEIADNGLVLAGMKAIVVSKNGEKQRNYTFVSADLLEGRNVWATSYAQENPPSNAVDGNDSTFWSAVNNQYPQKITVDLGEPHILGNLVIDWYEKNGRYYSYSVEVSMDGETFSLATDRRNNQTPRATQDSLGALQAQYVRVTIHSCSDPAGYASLYAMKLDGWEVTSDLYVLDHENRLILVPDTTGLTAKAFVSHLTYQGVRLSLPDLENNLISEGNRVLFFDINGNTTVYTVTTVNTAYQYPYDTAFLKPVFFSNEEGTSTDGADTHASNVNDGQETTEWVSKIDLQKQITYPAWIAVDLGKEYSLSEIELRFETKDNRVYQFQVWASSDVPPVSGQALPADYRVIIDQKNNRTFQDGHYTFPVNGEKARYIAVMVYGNTLFPMNPYAAAGIYDLKVFGTAYAPAE